VKHAISMLIVVTTLHASSLVQAASTATAPLLAPGAEYTDEVCENFHKIAEDFIDMELSGLRWQGVSGNPECLSKLKLQTASIDRVPASDPALLDPEFLLPENRKIDLSVKRLPNDLLDVVFNYIGRKLKKDVPVRDHFVLKLNFGHLRAQKGCASWYSEPEHFAMRSRCWKD
jgi:hypothetical protein